MQLRKKGFLHDPRAMMQRVIEVAGVAVSPHDMRRTFEYIDEYAGVDSDRRRVLINHIGGDVHSVNYANNSDPEVLMVEAQKVSKLSDAHIFLCKFIDILNDYYLIQCQPFRSK